MSGNMVARERGLILIRDSDPRQGGDRAQLENARRTARVNDLSIVAEIFDEGESGDDLQRAGLVEAERLIAQGHRHNEPVAWIVVDQSDRLSRADSIDTSEVLARYRRLGVRYIATPARTFDLRDKVDRLLLTLEMDHKNNPFLKDTARRVLDGMLASAREGFWVGGRIPFGYQVVRTRGDHASVVNGKRKRRTSGRLVLDEAKAPIALEAFTMYARGAGTRGVTAFLSASTGRKWTRRGATWVLRNTIYTGRMSFGLTPQGKHARLQDGAAVELLDDDQAGDVVQIAAYPRIVSDDLFRDVQRRLENASEDSRHKDTRRSALSGLCRCGTCGASMTSTMASRKYVYLHCTGRRDQGQAPCRLSHRRRDEALRRVLSLLSQRLLAGDTVANLIALAGAATDEAREEWQRSLDHARDALERCDTSLAKARRRLATADDDMVSEYQQIIRELKEERETLEGQLRQTRGQEPAPEGADVERLTRWLETCRVVCKDGVEMDGEALNDLLRELIAEVRLYPPKERKRNGPSIGRVEIDLPDWLASLISRPGTVGQPNVSGREQPTGPTGTIVLASDE